MFLRLAEHLSGRSFTQLIKVAAIPVISASLVCSLKPQKLKFPAQISRSNRRGAAVVEFAFIVPLLFFLILGMVEFGRMMKVEQVLTNAAVVGARQASLSTTTSDSTVTTKVDNYLSGEGISGHTTTVSPTLNSSTTEGTAITVTVSIRYGLVSLLGDAGLDLLTGQMFGANFGTIGGIKNKMLTGTVVVAREKSTD